MKLIIKNKDGMSWLHIAGLKNMGVTDEQISSLNHETIRDLGPYLRKEATTTYIQKLLNK